MNNEFATILMDARVNAGISRANLASLVGISKSTVRSYESAQAIPKPDTRLKLSKVLGVPLHILDRAAQNYQDSISGCSAGCDKCQHIKECQRRVRLGVPVVLETLDHIDRRCVAQYLRTFNDTIAAQSRHTT